MKVKPNKKNLDSSPNLIQKYGSYSLIITLSLIAYFPAFSNNLIDWDDLKYTLENPLIQDLSLKGIMNIFSKPVMGNYHPLTVLSLAINYALSGASPAGFHASNIFLHILNSLLVLVLAQRLGLVKPAALLCALLFALHPIHVESVAWVAERKDVLYTFFLLLAWIQYLNFRNNKENTTKPYLMSLVLFIAACLSKGMAVTLPVLLIASEFLRPEPFKMKPLLKYILPFILLSLLFGIIAIWMQKIQGGMAYQYPMSILERSIIGLRGYWFYLEKTLIPYGLSAIYPYPAEGQTIPVKWYLQALGAIIIFSVGVLSAFKNKKMGFVVLGYTGVIFPVLQWLPVGDAVAADRYFYVASIPVFMGIGMLLPLALNTFGKQVLPPVYLIIALLTGMCWYQASLWKDEIKLFSHTVDHYPEAAVAWNNIGAILQRQQNFPEAIRMYEKAIISRPDYTTALCNLGISYGKTGNMERAIALLERSVQSDSTHAESYGNLANAYIMSGRREEALRLFLKAVEINPLYVESWFNLGIYHRESGDIENAEKYFRKSVEIRPGFQEGWWSLSAVLFEKGDRKGAIEAARTSARLGNAQAAEWIKVNNLENNIF